MVLVVEDDQAIRDIFQTLFELFHVDGEILKNTEEGLCVFKDNQDIISTVISDISIGEKSGITFIIQLLEYKPDINVIIMSGHEVSSIDFRGLLEKENVKFIKKPFSAKILLEELFTWEGGERDGRDTNL